MTAVDTNVLVGLLTGDDAGQTAAARALFQAEPIWIARTALLETEWGLRSLYCFDESSVLGALVKLLALENVNNGDRPSVTAAISLASTGMDLPSDNCATRRQT